MQLVDIEKIISLLQTSPLFSKVKFEIIEEILKVSTLEQIKKSALLDSRNNMKYFHIILDGRIKLMLTDPGTGRSITILLLQQGDVFDIFPLLDGKEHITQAITLDDVTVLRVPLNKVSNWIKIYPSFNATFLSYTGNQLRILEKFGKTMVFYDTLTRLANLILHYTEQKKKSKNKYYEVKVIHNLSHEILAELIGTSRSVLSTQMQKLKNDGIIIRKESSLYVKNKKKLIEKSIN